MALLLELLDRPVLFFGGKGGVGKTTLAAATAVALADAGHETLLVSTDPAHSAGDALDVALAGEPRRILPRLSAFEIDPETEADRYVAGVKERLTEVASPRILREVEREIEAARLSPGAAESALFERVAEVALQAGGAYDRIVFDTAPTGHTLRLLSLPELMSVWIEGLVRRRRKSNVLARMWRNVAGAAASAQPPLADPVLDALEQRRARFQEARELLTDPARTAFHFVVTPERLSVLETRRAVEALSRNRIPVGGLFVNRVLRSGAERRMARQAEQLTAIAEAFQRIPVRYLPEVDDELRGPAALRELLTRVSASA